MMLLITQELEERKKSESLCLAPAAMETTSMCSAAAAAAVTCRWHHFLQKTDGQRQRDTVGGKDSWSEENIVFLG